MRVGDDARGGGKYRYPFIHVIKIRNFNVNGVMAVIRNRTTIVVQKTDARVEVLTKSQFAEWKPNLFNRRGHFKQFSVAVPRWLCIEPRGGVILAEEVKK